MNDPRAGGYAPLGCRRGTYSSSEQTDNTYYTEEAPFYCTTIINNSSASIYPRLLLWLVPKLL